MFKHNETLADFIDVGVLDVGEHPEPPEKPAPKPKELDIDEFVPPTKKELKDYIKMTLWKKLKSGRATSGDIKMIMDVFEISPKQDKKTLGDVVKEEYEKSLKEND